MKPRSILIAAIIFDIFISNVTDLLNAFTNIPVFAQVMGNPFHLDLPSSIRLILGAMYIICSLTGRVGMALLWNPARFLYLISWGLSLFTLYATGSIGFTSIGTLSVIFVGFSGGFLVCYAFFGPISEQFSKKTA